MNVEKGMKIKADDGTIGTITEVRRCSHNIRYTNGVVHKIGEIECLFVKPECEPYLKNTQYGKMITATVWRIDGDNVTGNWFYDPVGCREHKAVFI